MCGFVRDRDHDCQSLLTLLCRRHHCDPVRTAWACGMTGPAEASVVTYESGVGASGSCEGHAWVSLRGRVPETPGLELRLLCPRLASCCVVLSGFLSLLETPFPSCRRRGPQRQQHGATLPLARPFKNLLPYFLLSNTVHDGWIFLCFGLGSGHESFILGLLSFELVLVVWPRPAYAFASLIPLPLAQGYVPGLLQLEAAQMSGPNLCDSLIKAYSTSAHVGNLRGCGDPLLRFFGDL